MARDVNGRLALRNHLLAFRVVEGKLDGKNIGNIIFEILKEAVLLEKVSTGMLSEHGNPHSCTRLVNSLLTTYQIVTPFWRPSKSYSERLVFHFAPMVIAFG